MKGPGGRRGSALPLPRPQRGRGRGQGEGEGRQACAPSTGAATSAPLFHPSRCGPEARAPSTQPLREQFPAFFLFSPPPSPLPRPQRGSGREPGEGETATPTILMCPSHPAAQRAGWEPAPTGVGTSTPGDERSGEGARGKGRQCPPPSSPPAGERKGARGKGRAARRALPAPALQPVPPCSIHQDAGQRPALPARNHCVSNFRRSFSSAPHPPPSSPPAGKRKGARGKGRQRPPPSSPLRGAEGSQGEGEAAPSPFLAP